MASHSWVPTHQSPILFLKNISDMTALVCSLSLDYISPPIYVCFWLSLKWLLFGILWHLCWDSLGLTCGNVGVLSEPRSTPETYIRECHCFYYLCLLTQKGNWIRTQRTLKGHSSIPVQLLICDTLLLYGRFPVLLWKLWWNQSSVRFRLAVKPHSLSQEPLT